MREEGESRAEVGEGDVWLQILFPRGPAGSAGSGLALELNHLSKVRRMAARANVDSLRCLASEAGWGTWDQVGRLGDGGTGTLTQEEQPKPSLGAVDSPFSMKRSH